jgi:hypothetical protein
MDNIGDFPDELMHYIRGDTKGAGYSSKYYDPDKAHDYYEAHKELKGRRSNTVALDELRETGSLQLGPKRSDGSSVKKNVVDIRRQSLTNYVVNTKAQINTLRARFQKLSSLSGDEKTAEISKIQNEIQRLRSANEKMREKYMMLKSTSTKLSERRRND